MKDKKKKSFEILEELKSLSYEEQIDIINKLNINSKQKIKFLKQYNNGSRVDGFAGPMLLSLITLIYGIIFLVIIN